MMKIFLEINKRGFFTAFNLTAMILLGLADLFFLSGIPAFGYPGDNTNHSAVLKERAIFSDFPGIDFCQKLTIIPAGTEVIVTALFQDFAKIAVQMENHTRYGFLPKSALLIIPDNLPKLSLDEVPWGSIVDTSKFLSNSNETGGEIILTPKSSEEIGTFEDSVRYTVPDQLRIHFKLENIGSKWISFYLIGRSFQGLWWDGITRFDISVGKNHYFLCVYDGTKDQCSAGFDIGIPVDEEITLVFSDKNGKQLQIFDNTDHVVFQIDFPLLSASLHKGLFPEGWFQYGVSVLNPGTIKVSNLSFSSPPSGKFEKSWLTEPGLSELASPLGIMIGTEFSPDWMDDRRFSEVMYHDYDLAYLSIFSDEQIWKGPDDYDFETMDQIVDDSFRLGFTLCASHLVWGSYDEGFLPVWLKNGNYSKEELLVILKNHITTIVNRYKGKIKIWSIANEAPERDRFSGLDFWFDHIGPEYVEKSFQWAREADPDGILLLNSANNENPRDLETKANIAALYEMVSSLKEKNIPIDVVGMQMHFFLPGNSKTPPNLKEVAATMKEIGKLGVKLMITEMDVNLHELRGTPNEKLVIQNQVYADMMQACIESGVCISFSTWGVSDSMSWISAKIRNNLYDFPVTDAAPLLFDADYQPKQAYFTVQKVLLDFANPEK